MSHFPAAIAEMVNGGSLNAAALLYFGFADAPMFVWTGTGPLKTLDGQVWQGSGSVVTFDNISQVAGQVANAMTVKLAHDATVLSDPIIARARNSQNLVKGRRFFTAVQMFDANWQPVDNFFVTFVGVMDKMTVTIQADRREVSLTVEGPLVRRRTPRPGNFDDRDQKSIYPSDRAFEFVSGLSSKIVQWPKF